MEASHLLDMKKLMGDIPPNLLLPSSKKNKSLLQRSPDRYYFSMVIISVFYLIIRWIQNLNSIILLISTIIILGLYIQKNRIKDMYFISEKGFIVPYSWITQKQIQIDNIVEIYNEKLIESETGDEHTGIRITLDHQGLKFNTTGINEPNIILSSQKYDIGDLELFAEEIRKYKRNSSGIANTSAQRLTDQVNRSWNGRWKLIFFNTLDSSSEFGFLLLLLSLITTGVLGKGILPLFYAIYLLYTLSVLMFNIFDRPSAIIGIRIHELGALLYNEADLLTTVRFIMMGYPENIRLLDCEILFDGEPISQINDLKELHPEEIEAGSLTYCVAQFVGNQTKSIGANIHFSYASDREQTYELPIYWA
ncbi:MAG: hypothetical protein ACW99A_07810 [Candidatus Kariarchaeaceae archaeon]